MFHFVNFKTVLFIFICNFRSIMLLSDIFAAFFKERAQFCSLEKQFYHLSILDYVILSNLIPPPLNCTPLYQLTPQQSLERTLRGMKKKKGKNYSQCFDRWQPRILLDFGRADAKQTPRTKQRYRQAATREAEAQ